MTKYIKKWIFTPIKGSGKPIIVEFDYEDWQRLERLSNRKKDWILRLYDAVFKKAGLPNLETLRNMGIKPDVRDISAGNKAYQRMCIIGQKKYGKHWDMENLNVGMSNHFRDEDPPVTINQVLIRPIAFGSHTWRQDVIDAVEAEVVQQERINELIYD